MLRDQVRVHVNREYLVACESSVSEAKILAF